MKTLLSTIKLPKTLDDFNTIDTGNIEVRRWAGAVNFIFVDNSLLLIKRSETMASHKGQLAFIGGHKHWSEKEPIETAKREFEEETGLDAGILHIIGVSLPVKTSTQSVIFPVVSLINKSKSKLLSAIESNGEWVDAFLVPMEKLKDPRLWVKGIGVGEYGDYSIYFHPLVPGNYISKSQQDCATHLLWGATARMIWKFFKNYS